MDINQLRQKLPHLAQLDDAHLIDAVQRIYYPKVDKAVLAERLGVKVEAPMPEEPGLLRSVGDSGVALGRGLVSGVKMVSDAFGADNAVSEALGGARDSLGTLESDYRKAERQRRAQRIQEADESGSTWESIKANLGSLYEAPLDTLLEAAGTMAPTVAMAAIPGLGQANLARTVATAGMGAVQGAGVVKGEIYEAVERRLLEAGVPPEEAAARAAEAQAYDGPNQGNIAAGAGLGAAAGSTGIERIIGRGGATGGLAGRVAAGTVAEGIPEAVQGGQERYASNVALQREGFDVPTWQGVAGQAALEGAAGGLLGGGVSAFSSAPVEPSPNDGPLTRAVKAGGQDPAAPMVPPVVPPADAAPAGQDIGVPAAGLTEEQEAAALSRMEAQAQSDLQGLRDFTGRATPEVVRRGVPPKRQTPPQPGEEGSAQFVPDAAFSDRVLALREQLADERVREQVRERFGDDALNEITYYTSLADRADVDLPDLTRSRLLELAERGVGEALLRPIPGRPNVGANQRPEQIGAAPGVPQIGLDTAPTGTIRVDGAGRAAPETRADEIRTRQGQNEAAAERQRRNELGLTPDVEAAQARMVRPGDTLNPSGEPFKTRMAADRAAKKEGGAVVPVDGGFVVRKEQADDVATGTARGPGRGRAAGGADAGRGVGADGRPAAEPRGAVPGRVPADAAPSAPGGTRPAGDDAALTEEALTARYDAAKEAGDSQGMMAAARELSALRRRAQEPQTRDVQDAPPRARQTETQAPETQARAAVEGDAARAAGPADAGAPAVQADGVEGIARAITASISEQAIKRSLKGLAENVSKGRMTQAEADRRAEADAKMWAAQKPNDRTLAIAKAIAEKDPTVLVAAWAKDGQGIYGNEGSMEAFRKLTGINLKRLNSAERAKAIFDWAGWSEDRVRADVEKRKAARADAESKRAMEDAAKTEGLASRTPLKVQDQEGETTVKAYIDDLISRGFTEIRQSKVGAITKTYLFNPATSSGYPMSKGILSNYAKIASSRAKAARSTTTTETASRAEGADVTRPEGQPFATKMAAQREVNKRGLSDSHEVVPVTGGFIARAKTRAADEPQGTGPTKARDESPVTPEQPEKAMPEAEATHKDPGEPAEPVTRAVVTEAITKAAENRGRKPSDMRAELLAMIDAALPQAKDEYLPTWKEPTKARIREAMVASGLTNKARVIQMLQQQHENRVAEIADRIGYVTFKVPGDGTFKVLNTKSKLEDFRKRVLASPGFKSPARTPAPEGSAGGERGYGGAAGAITGMIDEGDPQAAVDYAAARGLEITEVLKGDKARLGKVAGLTPTAEAVGEFEPEAVAPAQPAADSAATDAQQAAQAPVSSVEGQKRLASRGSRIAVLKMMNDRLRRIAPDEAWADANIEDASNAELDGLQDQISAALVAAERGPAPVNPLRAELEEMSGAELRAIMERMNLAGARMTQDERIAALLAEDPAEVRAAMQQAAPSAPAARPGAVENFGEALPPARRNMAAKLSEELSDDAIASRPLSEIWPQAENDAIEDTFAAAVAHAARAEIPAKPRKSFRLKAWVEKVKTLRELAGMIVGGRLTREQMAANIENERRSLKDWWSKVQLLESIPRDQWKRIGAVQERPEAFTYIDGKQVPRPHMSVEVDGKHHVLRGDEGVDGYGGGTLAGNRAGIEALLGSKQPERRMEFDIRQRRKDGSVFVNKKGDAQHRPLMEFKSVEDARKAIREDYDALVGAWEAIKARDNITERDLRSAENRPRAGKDHRQGRDVTPQEFQEKFGFRGGEFGKWVQQGKGDSERQALLNNAYDALMDLADLLNIPPRAISLNGSLGIAFGSRGSGWASAHFEPSNLVINLTKTRGAGALAHEWFHALDNYFSRLRRDGKEAPFTGSQEAYRNANYITHKPEPVMVRKGREGQGWTMTKGALEARRRANPDDPRFSAENWIPDPSHPAGVRPEVEERFAAVVQAIADSPMAKRARDLDGVKVGSEGYWSRTLELAARSFENYIQARMMELGYHNDFLANVKPVEDVGRNPERYPYLLPGEVKPIADAFDALFTTIQTREGGDGNVEMFSIDDGAPQADTGAYVPASPEHQQLADTLGERLSRSYGRAIVLDAVAPGSGAVGGRGRELAAVSTVARRLFGHEVVFVRFQGKPLFNGAMSTAIPDVLFLNADSKKPLMAVLGHELLHHLKRTNESIYNTLNNRLNRLKKNERDYLHKLEVLYGRQGAKAPANWDEELNADIVGDFFQDPEFWAGMAKEQPGLFRRVVNAILKFLDDVAAKITDARPFGTDQYLTDIGAARAAVVDAMRQFSGAQVGAMTSQSEGISLSVADDPLAHPVDSWRAKGPQVAREFIEDTLTSQRGFNRWWHRTIGTQFHKSRINPYFRRTYEAVQRYLQDTSRMANAAADEAPDLLMRIESLADLKKMNPKDADLKAAGEAIFGGTLIDERVYTDAELKAKGLTDKQIGYYRQFRAAVDRSLDHLVATDVIRLMTTQDPQYLGRTKGEAAANLDALKELAAEDPGAVRGRLEKLILDRIAEIQAGIDGQPNQHTPGLIDKRHAAQTLLGDVREKFNRIQQLKDEGYAPLMRFGQYTVDVVDAEGERIYFGMYESQREANKAAREFRAMEGVTVRQGVQSQKEFEALKGLSPETVMLFAEMTGMEKNEAMQAWLKEAVAQQSALKRYIKRKGIAGFSPDLQRVLAAFVTSNARAASQNLHNLEVAESVESIPQSLGDVKDEALKLAQYVQNPQEEAQTIRSLMFVNYIGGSVASAMVNLSQTLVQTFPYLAQFGGAGKAAARITAAMKDAATRQVSDPDLRDAIARAEKDGVIQPQEIFQLQAEASRNFGSNPWVRKTLMVWGSMFQLAEQFNRRTAFIAAYRTAQEQGIANPFEFAENAVAETQSVFNKGNRPNWARGAVGATLFTFKTFSIQYVEFLKRLPPKERALALAILVAAAGSQGLPFAEDLQDVIDSIAQGMGYQFSSKRAMNAMVARTLGQGAADFLQHGFSTLPGVPLDVSARLGLGNLLPGTGVLKASETRKEDEVLETFGVVGSFVRDALKGEVRPIALRNAAKALDMYQTGMYRDTRGRRVTDVDTVDAVLKGLGLQPAGVAQESRAVGAEFEARTQYNKVRGEIAEQWALGIFEGDAKKVQAARDRLADWNTKNPQSPMRIDMPGVTRRVREMRKTRAERFVQSTNRDLRPAVREALQ